MPSTYQVESDRTELDIPSKSEYLVEFEADYSVGLPEIDDLETTSYTYVEINGRFYSLDDNGEPDYNYELILVDDVQQASFEAALSEAQVQVVEIPDKMTQIDGHEAWLILTYAPGGQDPTGRQLVEVSSRTELRSIELGDETEPADSPNPMDLEISDSPTQSNPTGPSGGSIDELTITDFESTLSDSGRYDVVFEDCLTDEELVEPVVNLSLTAVFNQDVELSSDTADSQRASLPLMRQTRYGRMHRQQLQPSVTAEASPSVDQLTLETPDNHVLVGSQSDEQPVSLEDGCSPMEVFDETMVISQQAADVNQSHQPTSAVASVEPILAVNQAMEQSVNDNSSLIVMSSKASRPVKAAMGPPLEYGIPLQSVSSIDTDKQSSSIEVESAPTILADTVQYPSVGIMSINRQTEMTEHVSETKQTPVDAGIDRTIIQNVVVVEPVAPDLTTIFAKQVTITDAPIAVDKSTRPVMTAAVEPSRDAPVDSYRVPQPAIDGDTVLVDHDEVETSVAINQVASATTTRPPESTLATVGSTERQIVADEHSPNVDTEKPIWLAQSEATKSTGWQGFDISPAAVSFDQQKSPTISQPTRASMTDDVWSWAVNDDQDIVFKFLAEPSRSTKLGRRLARMEARL